MQKWTWAVANCTLRMIYYLDDCNLLNVQQKKKEFDNWKHKRFAHVRFTFKGTMSDQWYFNNIALG